MSGGSFNYLFRRLEALHDELLVPVEDLDGMEHTLRQMHEPDVADAIAGLARDIREKAKALEVRVEPIARVAKAVEWWCSGDWSREQMRKAFVEWRATSPAAPPAAPPATSPAAPVDKRPERVLCAAVWYPDGPDTVYGPSNAHGRGFIWCGHNHAAILEAAVELRGWRTTMKHQGFITTENRYVDREEAVRIAVAAGQVPAGTDTLYAEDLTDP